ncbi:NAD-dependent epimerase/dehydratase family protein [Novipirellula sp.]|uniref:NAD-dependent epimerase/dehydratase family protein n=1 Tax=Novipirellula sp. TaxID=2795430 RepID=UPI003564A0AE
MKRCFLTGGTGFIGSAVTQLLADEGTEVGLFTRNRSKARELFDFHNLTLFDGDLHDSDALTNAVKTFKPDTVIHLGWAGITGVDRDDNIQLKNQQATIDLAQVAIRTGVKSFIGLGSQAEYGPKQGVISEHEPCNPVSLYGASKLASQCLTQQLCRIGNVRFAWVRLFSCFGPRDTPSFMIPTVIESLLNGHRPSLTAAHQMWDFLYVDDAARAIATVAKAKTRGDAGQGIFNLGSGTSVPLKDVIEQLRDLIDDNLPLGFGDLPYGNNQIMHLEADTTRLKQIGWDPVTPLKQGLATTINWHRAKREE